MTPNILWLRALFDSPALVTIIHCQCAIAHRNYIMATVSCWGINYIGYKKQLAIVFCSVYLWVVVIARPIEMPPKQNKTPLEYAERIRHNAQINSIRFASLRSGPLRASSAVTNIHTHTKIPTKVLSTSARSDVWSLWLIWSRRFIYLRGVYICPRLTTKNITKHPK